MNAIVATHASSKYKSVAIVDNNNEIIANKESSNPKSIMFCLRSLIIVPVFLLHSLG